MKREELANNATVIKRAEYYRPKANPDCFQFKIKYTNQEPRISQKNKLDCHIFVSGPKGKLAQLGEYLEIQATNRRLYLIPSDKYNGLKVRTDRNVDTIRRTRVVFDEPTLMKFLKFEGTYEALLYDPECDAFYLDVMEKEYF